MVSGQHVGHPAKDDAAKYQPVFNALVQQGFLPVTNCRIWGSEYDEWVGTDRRWHEIRRSKVHLQRQRCTRRVVPLRARQSASDPTAHDVAPQLRHSSPQGVKTTKTRCGGM
jgi:hypothetical protein